MATAALAGGPAAVNVDAALGAKNAAPGDPIEVVFHVTVPEGWHLYPPGATEGQAVEARLDPAPGVSAGALEPRGGVREMSVEGVGKFKVLEGTFDLAWRLQVAKDAAAGARSLNVTFVYQACTEQTCDKPVEVPFTLPLEVLPGVSVGPPVELPAPKPAIANFALPVKQLSPGQRGSVDVEFFVKKGFHIYAPGTEGDRATKLDLELPAGYTAGELAAPAPTRTETDDLGKANLWEGKVKLSRSFTVPADAKPGSMPIKANASWLVCDEKGCQPGNDSASFTLEVVPGVAPVATATATASSPTGTSGALILTAIGLGLINVLMPCTLPMIPITISIFSKGKKLSRGESLFRASVYAAGIVVSFVIMGGVVQAFFGSQGQGVVRTIASNGPLNLAIAGLFVYFALSFFGYYEIDLPEFLRNFVQKSVDKAKETTPGETGIPLPALFLMGFFFVLTSYTCGAPLVLGVLTAGLATPGKASVLLGTGVFGATTAAPFFVLALVPGLLKSLPKSGGWFKTFKVALGTVELAAALKFFSNADLYWRAHILTRNVFIAIWIAAGVFLTLYVAHVIKLSHDEEAIEPEPKFQPKAWLRALPFLLATIYFAQALNGSIVPAPGSTFFERAHFEIAANLDAFLPPDPYPVDRNDKVARVPDRSPGRNPDRFQLPDYPSYDKALAAAKASGKLLFLEFSGHV